MQNQEEISKIFKTEYSNLVAVLCQYYGLNDIQTAEDVVSDTFLTAMKSWSHNGVPDQPKAWLRKVASNKVKDLFKRNQLFREKVMPTFLVNEAGHQESGEVLSDAIISDSQLNMIFRVCHPSLKVDAQICLALRILCGFNIEEIAIALLSQKGTINKKLYRAKQTLKAEKETWEALDQKDYEERLGSVLRIIYLIFNEGYYSSISDVDIREDLCWEAMRLGVFMSKQARLPQGEILALLALMCFHASRLNSRTDQNGQYILYTAQDRSLWNQALIKKGEQYLSQSASGNDISKYHLEAAIAFWHCTDAEEKWKNILQLYNRLLIIAYSPVVAMNRTFALAHAHSVQEAIGEALKLNLSYSLLAELHRMDGNISREIEYLNLSIQCAKKSSEVSLLNRKLEKAKQAIR